MKEINAHLTFDGNCREAMTFYQGGLGGELKLMPFSEVPGNIPKEARERIVHGRLTNGRALLMASDSMPGMPLARGSNFSVAVQCDSGVELERLFAAIGEKGKVILPLQDTFWGSRFGMLVDQFGVNWMFNFEQGQ